MTADLSVSDGRVETPAGSAPIIPVILIGAGGYLLWFGVRYWRGTGPAVWPSYPVRAILQGKGLPAPQQAPKAADAVAQYEGTLPQPAPPPASPPPGGGGQPKNAARLLLSRFGWGADQMPPLIKLWTRESGWSPTAFNPSGAYGIAQALGHAKSGECATGPRSIGSTTPGVNCAYSSDYGLTPADAHAANAGQWLPQVRWGLGYIKARYGSPAAAWAHEQSVGWYVERPPSPAIQGTPQ